MEIILFSDVIYHEKYNRSIDLHVSGVNVYNVNMCNENIIPLRRWKTFATS